MVPRRPFKGQNYHRIHHNLTIFTQIRRQKRQFIGHVAYFFQKKSGDGDGDAMAMPLPRLGDTAISPPRQQLTLLPMFYDRNVLFCTLPQNLRYKVQSTVQVHVQVQGRTSLTYG